MIKEKNIALCVIFSIITCGFYSIYWFITLTDETNEVSGTPTASGGLAFLFSMITCGIYRYYWSYKVGEKIDTIKRNRGLNTSDSGVLYLILCIFGFDIIAYCLAQSELNKLA